MRHLIAKKPKEVPKSDITLVRIIVKKKTAKQGQNIWFSGKPTSLFMILLCFIWKKCEKLLMLGKSLCNQFRITPDTLHSDPPNTWRPLLFL